MANQRVNLLLLSVTLYSFFYTLTTTNLIHRSFSDVFLDDVLFPSEYYNATLMDVAATTKGKKPQLILHIGPPKTGSTYIQCALHKYRPELEKDGFIFVGKVPPDCSPSFPNPMWPDTDFQHNIVVCAKRTVMNGGKAPNSCLEDLTGGLKRFAGLGKNIILSDEVFSLRAIEKDPLKAPIIESMFLFLVEMLESWDVQVVTVYRRYYEWSMSVYNHLNKHTKSRKLAKKWPGKEGGREVVYPMHWFEADGNFKGQSFFPYTNDAKFKDFFPVTVLNIHGEIDVSEQFICHALDNANHACRSIRSPTSYVEEMSTRNPSVSLNYDMLAIEAHRLKLLKEGLQREKVGNVARYFHEKITKRENNDFDVMTCIPRHLLDNILNKSIDRERENFPDLLGTKMSESRLKNNFEEFVKSGRFCNVDTKQLIEKDLKWHSFFTSLGRGGPKDLYNILD